MCLRELTVDSKGKISIPADIRRNYKLGVGSVLVLCLDLENNILILSPDGRGSVKVYFFKKAAPKKEATSASLRLRLPNGQSGVMSSTGACGTALRGSCLLPKDVERKTVQKAPDTGENTVSGPARRRPYGD